MSNREQQKRTRKSYPAEFKTEALKLAESVGVPAAAKELGIGTSQLYGWRQSARRAESSSEAEKRLMNEVAALKRQLAEQKQEMEFLKKASSYFASRNK